MNDWINSLTSLPPEQGLAAIILEKQRRTNNRKLFSYYPDEGALRRELYPKHMMFFEAGARYRQRFMIAANRIGKTEGVGLYEETLHATGLYPAWWKGRRYPRASSSWVAGDTGKTAREILQFKLLGPMGAFGTGLIPKENLHDTKRAQGVADAIEIIYVKHTSGGIGRILLKSYDQGREAFQGTEPDRILLDEEPPMDVYIECLTRTMTNNGMLTGTFTPLQGISEVVMTALPEGILVDGPVKDKPGMYVVGATWDDVPHIPEDAKAELLASIPPFQRDARSKGIPMLGAGAIYPIEEEAITIDDFPIPDSWPRVYGLDVGWKKTAAVWGAYDPETKKIYLYAEYARGNAEPSVHAQAIKNQGTFIRGVIDPASRGRAQADGKKLIEEYQKLGLHVTPANNAVEAGLLATWQLMSEGRLKIFKSLRSTLGEYRLYRRDEKGRVVKENDHLMDAMRYLVMSGRGVARSREKAAALKQPRGNASYNNLPQGWMGT
jgi:phage terminase large subunit-like protein